MEDIKKIKELLELMKEYELIEMELKNEDGTIRLTKSDPEANRVALPALAAPMAALPAAVQAGGGDSSGGASAKDPSLYEFKSPMVGTFYRAPSPESPPYVTEGDKATKDTVLCIVEAMKVMNEIKAETSGEIIEILVENGEAVEFGQPLFLIRRAE